MGGTGGCRGEELVHRRRIAAAVLSAALATCALPGPPRDVAVSGSRVLAAVAGPALGGSGDPAVLILRLAR